MDFPTEGQPTEVLTLTKIKIATPMPMIISLISRSWVLTRKQLSIQHLLFIRPPKRGQNKIYFLHQSINKKKLWFSLNSSSNDFEMSPRNSLRVYRKSESFSDLKEVKSINLNSQREEIRNRQNTSQVSIGSNIDSIATNPRQK